MRPAQIVLALILAAACTYTVVGFPRRYGALSGRSRLFRTLGLFLLDLLLFLALLGTLIDFMDPERPRVSALRAASYLLACIFLLLSVICIAVLDWLESLVAYRRAHRDILYGMITPDTKENEGENNDRADGEGRAFPP